MARGCHGTSSGPAPAGDGARRPVIALAGNPNVGKSTLFNHLTGSNIVTAHYAGTTIDVSIAQSEIDGRLVDVVDLPGTYSLAAGGDSPSAVSQALAESDPDTVVLVVDATNISRNLPLAFEILDRGLPVVLALNLADEAARSGVSVDVDALAQHSPAHVVVSTVAVTGEGVLELMRAALDVVCERASGSPEPIHRYDIDFERVVGPLVNVVESRGAVAVGRSGRALALSLLEMLPEVEGSLLDQGESGLIRVAAEVRSSLAHASGAGAPRSVAEARHRLAAEAAGQCVHTKPGRSRIAWERLATSPRTGIPMLGVTLATIFLLLFFVGELLAGLFSGAWSRFASPYITSAVHAIAGDGVVGSTPLWGLDSGIEAALGIGLPYILTFYLLPALIEDSGLSQCGLVFG